MNFTTEDIVLMEVLSKLDGLSKENAIVIIEKIRVLLGALNSPINAKKIKEAWFPEMEEDKKNTP